MTRNFLKQLLYEQIVSFWTLIYSKSEIRAEFHWGHICWLITQDLEIILSGDHAGHGNGTNYSQSEI